MRKSGCFFASLVFLLAAVFLWTYADDGNEPYAVPSNIKTDVTPTPCDREITPDPYSGTLLLVNVQNPLPEDYYPENIVTIYGNITERPFALSRADLSLRAEALEALIKMLDAAENDGKKNYMMLSGYRDYAKQASLFADAVPQGDYLDTQPPGASEHQTGLAVDICKQSVDMRGFLDTSEGAWVLKNAANYGYILRFEREKSDLTGVIYEPWHFRYVGAPHAQIIVSKGFCLEEYIDWIRDEECIRVTSDAIEYEIKSVKSDTVPVSSGSVVSGDNKGGFIVTTRLQ